jgi:dipeptidyl aminopeptidase/acylaminoacyl peptidase
MRGSVVTVGAGALTCAVFCFSAMPHARQVEPQRPASRVPAPIPIEEGTGSDQVSSVQPSPDGTAVAYGVFESWRREPAWAAYFLPTGTGTTVSGGRVEIVDVRDGRVLGIDTPGPRTSSWAPAWSPDGTSLAFVSDRDGHPRIWRWDRRSGGLSRVSDVIVVDAVRRVTMEPWRLLQWTPDARAIVARVLPEKMGVKELAEYSSVAQEDGSVLFSESEPTALVYPRRDSKAADGAGPPNLERYRHFLGDLAAVDVATGQVSRLASRVHAERYDLSPDGRHLAWYDVAALRIIDVATTREIATDAVKTATLPRVDLEWAGTSDHVLHLVDGALRRVDVASGAATPVSDVSLTAMPVWNRDQQAWFMVDGQRLLRLRSGSSPMVIATLRDTAFVSWLFDDIRQEALFSKPGLAKLWLWTRSEDTEPQQLVEVALDTGLVRPADRKAASGHERARLVAMVRGRPAVYRHQDATHSPNLWVATPDAGEPRQLSHTGAVYERYVLGEHRLIEWLTDDGERRRGAMLLPAGYKEGTRVPMVVWVYGNRKWALRQMETLGLEGRNGNFQLLATRGYAVLIPESDIKPGTPMLDMVKSVLPGVSKAVELGYADERRLGVMGHSFGGYNTLSLIAQTRRFRAAIAYAGFANLTAFWGSKWNDGHSELIDYFESRDNQIRIEGTPWEMRERYIENSPFFYLDRVTTPLLLIHGDIDGVPASGSDQVYFALRRLGKPVEYARYRDTGHSMTHPANVIDYWRRVIEWFDRHLKSDATPAYGEPPSNGVP